MGWVVCDVNAGGATLIATENRCLSRPPCPTGQELDTVQELGGLSGHNAVMKKTLMNTWGMT